MPNVRGARLARAARLVVVLLLVGLPLPSRGRAEGPPKEAAWETLSEGEPAGAEYLGRVKAFVASHAAELERLSRDARERDPCARAEVVMSLLVRPDGSLASASSESTPPLPEGVRDAFEAAARSWKLPPTPEARPLRVRVPLGALPVAPPAPRLACDAELLDRGGYNVTDLVPGVERGKWWAVCRSGGAGTDAVRAVTIHLKRFRSHAAGDDRDEMTGRQVVVKGCDAPAFLFRGLPTPKEGPMAAAEVVRKSDAWNTTADISLPGARYHLRVQTKPSPSGGDPERPWTILLEGGGAPEELDAGHTVQPPLVQVRWAGDLDGDGRPDFVLEDRAEAVSLQLFLSSAAGGGRNVRRVATTSYGD